MDTNGLEATTKPLISSLKPEEEEVVVVEEDFEESSLFNEEEDDDSKRLLAPRNGGMSRGASKIRRSVQWNDTNGNRLAEILEFQPSEASDSDDEDSDSCFCTIM